MTSDVAFYDVLPMDGMRRAISRRMRAAVTEIPHVTLHRSVRASSLVDARDYVAQTKEATNAHVTVSVMLAHLVAISLRAYPRINGRTEEGEVRLYHRVNLGIAIAVEDGLVVPVVRDADQKTPVQIAEELTLLAKKARDGRLHPMDVSDATFTISNLGTYGVEHFTPIINPPQLGILGVGAMVPRLILEEGHAKEVPYLGLSLSFDHSALDGAQAARFLEILTNHMEEFKGMFFSAKGKHLSD